ncbi:MULTISPECIES: MFS transporter [unclassified Streptomyces]|uniref:MFS transporter n=1 Tax=unclassified Streptomyces TaxID=2593676 RepID=UPI0037F61DE8
MTDVTDRAADTAPHTLQDHHPQDRPRDRPRERQERSERRERPQERRGRRGRRERPAVRSRHPRWTLLVVMAGTFMAIMDSFIVNVAVPSIRQDLAASYAQTELAVGGYVLVYGLLLVTGGRLGDLYGVRRLFLTGTAVFLLGSLAAGLAPDPVTLVAFRAVQAAGAALFYPQVLAVLQTLFTGHARARAFAVFGATIGLASIAGQVLGGLLVHLDLFGLGWRTVFLVNVPVGLATLAGAARLLPSAAPRTAPRAALDVTGTGLLSTALLLLLVPLVEGPQSGWPAWTWIALAASAPALAAFTRRERRLAARGADPLVDPRLFRLPAFASGSALALAFFAGNAGLFFVLTLHLQNAMGYTPLAAGLTFAPLAAAFAGASLAGPRLEKRLGHHTLTLGHTLNILGTLTLLTTAWTNGSATTAPGLLPSLAVIGLGQGLGVSPLMGAVLAHVPTRDAGAAAGVLETAIQIGMTLGIVTLGLIHSTTLGDTPTPSAHSHAFTVTLTGNLALAVLTLLLLPPLLRRR